MKRALIAAVLLSMCVNALAAESMFMQMREDIVENSKMIKSLPLDSKDVLIISSMWDSCIMTITQLDAYFSLVGMYNTIPQDQVTEEAIGYLELWLKEIKTTNELNLKSLTSIKQEVEPNTELHLAALRVFYRKFNKEIEAELEKLSLLKQALKEE